MILPKEETLSNAPRLGNIRFSAKHFFYQPVLGKGTKTLKKWIPATICGLFSIQIILPGLCHYTLYGQLAKVKLFFTYAGYALIPRGTSHPGLWLVRCSGLTALQNACYNADAITFHNATNTRYSATIEPCLKGAHRIILMRKTHG